MIASAARRPGARGAAGLAVLLVLAFAAGPRPAAADGTRYVARLANRNKVGMTVTNYGFFGNNFTSRSASLEYPLGSGYEHMSRAGLWIGARALSDSGAFIGVSTALVDAIQGSASADETEFSPLEDVIRERSRLANSRVFSPDAISDQDLLCTYTDAIPKSPVGNQREKHRPLGIRVRQVMLGFTLRAAESFEVARFVITNDGAPLEDVWLGM